MTELPFDIQSLHSAYGKGVPVVDIIEEMYRRIEEISDPGIFIYLEHKELILAQARELGEFDPVNKPLWGIPYVIKDNIDAEGLPTTAACPDFIYEAQEDAFCVALLREAGAILIGKTNLDQFATGLVGLRSPYAPPKNAVDPAIIPGGSSSGSAVAVGHGFVSFSLGTDTAGSGRIPAAVNNIVGLKPSLGALSATGVVPACKTLDTDSIFALNVDDAFAVYKVANEYDKADGFSRKVPVTDLAPLPGAFTVGVPSVETREFYGDVEQEKSFDQTLEMIRELGGTVIEIDFSIFYQVAQMLYEGAWVAERFTVVDHLLENKPDALHKVTKEVIQKAEELTAADVFRNIYYLAELRAKVAPVLASVDMFCVPTAPTYYTVEQVEAEPIDTNARLGTYTNFVNLLDMCGMAVPVAKREDGRPGSVTLLAAFGCDAELASLARVLHKKSEVSPGATNWALPELKEISSVPTDDEIKVVVVGAHMSGLPLNGELTRLNARFLRKAKTADCYRFYALAGGPPYRPGLVRTDEAGASMEIETWAVPKSRFGEFMAGIPSPLGIGTLMLDTGEQVKGFICEAFGIEGATEITSFGGWRNYMASLAK